MREKQCGVVVEALTDFPAIPQTTSSIAVQPLGDRDLTLLDEGRPGRAQDFVQRFLLLQNAVPPIRLVHKICPIGLAKMKSIN